MSPTPQGENLLKLADVDKLLMQLNRQLSTLPERPKLEELATACEQLTERADQVAKLRLRQEMSIKALRDEDQTLKAKIAESQNQIEQNSSRYKEVALWVSEIESLNKRLEKIAFDTAELNEGIEKISDVEGQLEQRIAQANARQDDLKQSLSINEEKIKEQCAKLEKQRVRLAQALPEGLVRRYEQQRGLKQGIGAAALDGPVCSACHIELTEGQLAKARREADEDGVGVCPSCLRLLVI